MANGRLVGESLILPQARPRAPNTAPLWRYILVLVVLVIGGIYAAPNLYQPDPALRVKPRDETQVVSTALLDRLTSRLEAEGIAVKATELIENAGVIRLTDSNDQRPAQNIVEATVNQERYVTALDQASNTPQWLQDIGAKPMSLGLDLSGGVHFLLQVNMEKFIGDRIVNEAEGFRDILRKERVRYDRSTNWVQGDRVEIPFVSEEELEKGRALIEADNPGLQILERPVNGKPGLRISYTDDKLRELQDFAIQQNLTSLRNRVNELGVAEPQVQRLGRERIVLDLPGLQDPARAKDIINKFANLQFRLVSLPTDRPSQVETFDYEGAPVKLQRRNIVTGNDVINAIQDYDQETGQPQVSITLDADGGEKMHDVTKDHVNDDMAIIYIEDIPIVKTALNEDGEEVTVYDSKRERRVINVANINSALGFRFRITGLEFNEARDLALLLRAGALAAPMYIVEERTVGASLGEDNIRQGQQSLLIGLALVIVFMVIYYKGFGLAATFALTANLVLIVAIMSVLGATLTLPGIAGIVLTVGMAVDANVLIFSRIKEELQERSPQQAIQSGFDRAFVTILDANLTTFFVAIILFSIGSGPVKGFAVTLAVGIVTSMFTAIMGTRSLINLFYGGRELKKVNI